MGRRSSTASSVKRRKLSGSISILIVGICHLLKLGTPEESLREEKRTKKGTETALEGLPCFADQLTPRHGEMFSDVADRTVHIDIDRRWAGGVHSALNQDGA